MAHQLSRYAKQFRDDPQDSSKALIKKFPCKFYARGTADVRQAF
jgi:hypothetical protein